DIASSQIEERGSTIRHPQRWVILRRAVELAQGGIIVRHHGHHRPPRLLRGSPRYCPEFGISARRKEHYFQRGIASQRSHVLREIPGATLEELPRKRNQQVDKGSQQ